MESQDTLVNAVYVIHSIAALMCSVFLMHLHFQSGYEATKFDIVPEKASEGVQHRSLWQGSVS